MGPPPIESEKEVADLMTEKGMIKTTIIPGMSADVPPRMEGVPVVGQHNDKIMAELDKME